jgi:hypothetical protein
MVRLAEVFSFPKVSSIESDSADVLSFQKSYMGLIGVSVVDKRKGRLQVR